MTHTHTAAWADTKIQIQSWSYVQRSRRRGSWSNNNEYIWRKTRNRTLNQDGATLAADEKWEKNWERKKNIQK